MAKGSNKGAVKTDIWSCLIEIMLIEDSGMNDDFTL